MEKIEILEKTVASLVSEMNTLKESVASGFKKVESNFEKVEDNFKNLSKKVDELSSGVDQLRSGLGQLSSGVDDLSSGTTNNFGKVDVKLDSLADEIKKIGEVTRYESEYENLSSIEKQKRAN